MTSPEGPLTTDLYELNMVQAYLDRGEDKEAVFEFFVRRLPERRGFLLAAGLDDALAYLETLRFSPGEIDWLKSTKRFRSNLIDYLAAFRFTGDVHAIPEGTVCFPNEPLIRITAPLPMAQIVETRLINILHFQTMIASKAARMVLAAPGKILSDFGLRTAHGAEAGLFSARASYIAGFGGAANVLAGERYGIPIVGTMAHSFVQVHDDEMTAFENFARSRPEGVILLIDTYDTEAGARKVVELAPKLKADGIAIRGVRIDSGNLTEMAKKGARHSRCRRARRGHYPGERRHQRRCLAEDGRGESADRRLRHRRQPRCLDRRALARLCLQAAGLRRQAPPQALRRQADLARPQAGVASLRCA